MRVLMTRKRLAKNIGRKNQKSSEDLPTLLLKSWRSPDFCCPLTTASSPRSLVVENWVWRKIPSPWKRSTPELAASWIGMRGESSPGGWGQGTLIKVVSTMNRDELHENRSSRKIDSQRLFLGLEAKQKSLSAENFGRNSLCFCRKIISSFGMSAERVSFGRKSLFWQKFTPFCSHFTSKWVDDDQSVRYMACREKLFCRKTVFLPKDSFCQKTLFLPKDSLFCRKSFFRFFLYFYRVY